MAIKKRKSIVFTNEMENEFNYLKKHIQTKFNVRPSDTDIQNLLLKAFQDKKELLRRKPKSKEIIW